ncbi:oxidoreductase [Halolactibacillus alkaliphilus]|uniref:Oxidoreductase n=1 Tax=Halolactibacillus alkaliphilus TaxID=442899 RepID=A0A511X576_9BACI|nr:SDR family oxidoreductase [Halolactibacillus alkaliphilus]GEN58091.1 oxidoreductase [Halolactibacillus alkaliphilus]GGN64777.1 oxidoreductase [Halolactibacillus alkaliphilus]SFP13790.1 hypothetical protein SAMN05720591_1602 [Halolactibacillus alkaliphilus]
MKKDTIIITGATRGLGRALSLKLARTHRTLVLVSRNEDLLTQLKRDLEKKGARVFIYPVDLTKTKEIAALVADIQLKTGGVNVVINNAGFGLFEYAAGTPREVTENMFQLNVLAMIEMNRLLIPQFIDRQGAAHIINIGSMAGKLATPKASSYAATKHAVVGYSNALRLELQTTNINVTTVNLGPVDTSFFETADESGHYQEEVKRIMLKPEVVAEKIARLIYKNKRELNLPGWMHIGSKLHGLSPRVLEFLMRGSFNRK